MIDFAVNIVLILYNLLFHNLGLTIIVIGILSRVVVWPLTQANLRYTKKMQEVKPQLDELKRIHGSDRKRHSEEQMKLFKEVGINPAAGCLPLIVQIAVLLFIYQIVNHLIHQGLNANFLWLNLGRPDAFKVSGVPFALPGALVLLTAVATLLQTKMMLPTPIKINKEDKPKEKEEKEDLAGSMANVQGQMLFLSPLLIAYVGTSFPAGLALYWLVTTVLAIVQQYLVGGWGGLNSWLKKLKLVK